MENSFKVRLISSILDSSIRIQPTNKITDNLYKNYIEHLQEQIFPLVERVIIYDCQKYVNQNSRKMKENLNLDKVKDEYISYITSKSVMEDIYIKYPLLKDVIKQTSNMYNNFFLEIVENFNKEKNDILEKFQIKDENISIKDIETSKGDLHDGKSVATITLENGYQLIYKPRATNNASLFRKIIEYIDQNDINIGYKFCECLIYKDHTWEEKIIQKPCYTLAEVKNYYYRAGVLLFAMYILNATDMHHENVICHGEYPVLIDFETLSNAFIQKNNEVTNFRNPLYSVLNTGFLPFVNPEGAIDINMGGILSSCSGVSNKIYDEVATINDAGELEYKSFPIAITKSSNFLEYLGAGKNLSNIEIKNQLVLGFKNASNIILNNKNKFLELIDSFNKNNPLKFRQILRPTQIYAKFIKASLHPKALSSQEIYEDIFEILITNFKSGKNGYLRVDYEIAEMKKQCVPLFYTKYEDTNLYAGDNIIINKEYYYDSIKNNIINKVKSLDDDLVDYQISLIEMTIFCLEKEDNIGQTYINKKQNLHLDGIGMFMNRLLSLEYRMSDSFSTMYLPYFYNSSNNPIKISKIDCQLYQGGGLILLLLYYGYYENKIQYIEYAKRLFSLLTHNTDVTNLSNLSVFVGYGGLLYMAYNFYKVTDDYKYFDYFMTITENFFIVIGDKLKEIKNIDFLDGITSTLYFLTNIKNKVFINKFKSEINNCFQNLLLNENLFVKNEVGMAHGISGIVLCLSSYYKFSPNSNTLSLILSLIEKENNLIEKDLKNISNSWCRGKSGILLARNIILNNLNSYLSSIQKNSISKFNYDFLQDNLLYMKNYCLCHGIYGNIDVLNFLNKKFNVHYLKDDLFLKRFDSFDELNWTKESDYPLESFMLGNGGIAYVILETKYNLPSILALEVFEKNKEITI